MKFFLATLVVFFTHSINAAIITFDEFEIPGRLSASFSEPVDIGAYRFTPVDGSFGLSVINFAAQDLPSYSGSAGISTANGSNIVLTRIDGQAFSALSLDIDQVFALDLDISFELTGALAGGGLITQTFSPDTSIGYESLILTGFSNITSLRLGTASLANWDNINLTPVPLPSVIWLFGSGLLGLLGIARRR